MAITKKLFHRQETGSGDEDKYYLARDIETGRVSVIHWSSHRGSGDLAVAFLEGERKQPLSKFLNERGDAQNALLRLIGSLVKDNDMPSG